MRSLFEFMEISRNTPVAVRIFPGDRLPQDPIQ
jgi:hypothetical protein